MGSINSLLTDPSLSYILGLWGADKYTRSSSVGLSNTNQLLIEKFVEFLKRQFPIDRLRLRVYGSSSEKFPEITKSYCTGSKNISTAYHIYVNSRPLLRVLSKALENRDILKGESLDAYFAGRFDGDGSISRFGKRHFCRIVYSNLEDATKDRKLLNGIKNSVYHYSKAGTYCIYFSEKTLEIFLKKITPYSIKLRLPRID